MAFRAAEAEGFGVVADEGYAFAGVDWAGAEVAIFDSAVGERERLEAELGRGESKKKVWDGGRRRYSCRSWSNSDGSSVVAVIGVLVLVTYLMIARRAPRCADQRTKKLRPTSLSIAFFSFSDLSSRMDSRLQARRLINQTSRTVTV